MKGSRKKTGRGDKIILFVELKEPPGTEGRKEKRHTSSSWREKEREREK